MAYSYLIRCICWWSKNNDIVNYFVFISFYLASISFIFKWIDVENVFSRHYIFCACVRVCVHIACV